MDELLSELKTLLLFYHGEPVRKEAIDKIICKIEEKHKNKQNENNRF